MHRNKTFALALCAATLALSAAATEGQKLDSGLGDLPHYSLWADKTGANPMSTQVAGESLDDGLGSLPHYSQWVDKSGRDPMGRDAMRMAGVQ